MIDSGVAHDPAALSLSWDDSHAGAMALLPTGPVWPRDPTGVLSQTVRGLVGVHWRAWRRVTDLLNEADPRTCYETIGMWETDCGLPDPCVDPPPSTIEGRRAAVIARRQQGGVSTPADFVAFAALLGYEIEVVEFRPFRVWSNCTDFINEEAAGWPHTWVVNILNYDLSIRYMTCTSGCTEFLSEWTASEIECAILRIAPSHTEVIFAFPPVPPP